MQDEVDRLVAAWARERPDLDVRAAGGAQPRDPAGEAPRPRPGNGLRRARVSRAWEFDVLAALRRAGKPYMLSPGPSSRQTPGHLGHHDQPGRPARGPRPGRTDSPTRPTAGECASG